jgi:hypothetical protein
VFAALEVPSTGLATATPEYSAMASVRRAEEDGVTSTVHAPDAVEA